MARSLAICVVTLLTIGKLNVGFQMIDHNLAYKYLSKDMMQLQHR